MCGVTFPLSGRNYNLYWPFPIHAQFGRWNPVMDSVPRGADVRRAQSAEGVPGGGVDRAEI